MKTTRKKLGNIAIGLLIPLILLILWEYFGRIGVIRQTILPRPTLLLKKLTPILILLFGIGELSKIVVIMIGSFWPVLLNTIQGIESVDPKLLELGSVLEKKRLTVIFQIILPSAFSSIFTGLRLGISSSWTNIVAAEMIAASSGMGHMISYAREMSQPAIVLIGVLTIGLVGLLIDTIVIQIQKKAIYWVEQK